MSIAEWPNYIEQSMKDFNKAHKKYNERIAELEAELAQCLDCCQRVGQLEAENAELRQQVEILEEDIRGYQADL
jgi:cell shape-determining protein MreC